MSSSMMRGIALNNAALSINMRDNLVIQIDDSDGDSDDNTLHIVEESIEESIEELIEVDESDSDDKAIDLSITGRKYMSTNVRENGYRPEPVNFHKVYSLSQSSNPTNKHLQIPKLTVTYQPHQFGYSNGNGISNTFNHPPRSVSELHQQSNGFALKIPNGNPPNGNIPLNGSLPPNGNIPLNGSLPPNGSLPSINLQVTEMPAEVNESFIYQCEFCSESFSSDQLLIDHCARMHPKDVKCQHCEKTFYWEKDLHFHMRKHIKKGRGFKCQICTGLFIKGAELKAHMKLHEVDDAGTDGSFACGICDKTFKSSKTLQDHKKRFMHKQCEVCLEYFSSDATLLQHFNVHSIPTSTTNYSCEQCGELFAKKSLMKMHRDKHRSYVCELCSAEFRRKDDIKAHLRMDCTKRTLFNCTVCNKSFISESKVQAHINTRHYDRNKCEFCEEKFLHRGELEEHLAHHNIEHPYQCQICLSPMSSKRIFNFHLKSHNDKTKFECEKCCRWFQSGHILQNHIKSHSRDTFNCTVCAMSFSDQQRLDQHSRSHDENKFKCDICNRSFRTRQLIFLHMIDSHQSKKKCHICDKEFINQSRLMTHLKSHYVKVEFPDEVENMESGM